jgi:hypothetical protein
LVILLGDTDQLPQASNGRSLDVMRWMLAIRHGVCGLRERAHDPILIFNFGAPVRRVED